ncbi:hypothetical protein HDC93_003075 [Streptomyces sp. AK010]|nr:hypothetical protein [Streptomyces sp. AK010]
MPSTHALPRLANTPWEVREAFFLIADRQELADGALSGAGEVANDLFGKGYEYYASALPQRSQDLDRALLKRADCSVCCCGRSTSGWCGGARYGSSPYRWPAAPWPWGTGWSRGWTTPGSSTPTAPRSSVRPSGTGPR